MTGSRRRRSGDVEPWKTSRALRRDILGTFRITARTRSQMRAQIGAPRQRQLTTRSRSGHATTAEIDNQGV